MPISGVGPQSGGPPLCTWCTEEQRRTPGKGALQVPERVELPTKAGQRGFLIISYKRLENRLWSCRDSCGRGSPCPCALGAARIPTSQAAAPPLSSTLVGTELPQAKKVLRLRSGKKKKKVLRLCAQGHFSSVWLFVDCGLPGFSVREGGSPDRNTGAYWTRLFAIPF